jgi:hypothetical protein
MITEGTVQSLRTLADGCAKRCSLRIGSTIYWYVESWDELGRYAKTDVMSFVLAD